MTRLLTAFTAGALMALALYADTPLFDGEAQPYADGTFDYGVISTAVAHSGTGSFEAQPTQWVAPTIRVSAGARDAYAIEFWARGSRSMTIGFQCETWTPNQTGQSNWVTFDVGTDWTRCVALVEALRTESYDLDGIQWLKFSAQNVQAGDRVWLDDVWIIDVAPPPPDPEPEPTPDPDPVPDPEPEPTPTPTGKAVEAMSIILQVRVTYSDGTSAQVPVEIGADLYNLIEAVTP